MPTQQITYLGFEMNSCDMSITLTPERKHKLREACLALLRQTKVKIRTVACCIGLMVASFLAVQMGPLHYKALEESKKKALKDNNGNWEKNMQISVKGKTELQWWIDHILEQKAPIQRADPSVTLKTDSSLSGWGALRTDTGQKAQGLWGENEKYHHENYLELSAILLGLKSLLNNTENTHIRVMTDNTTAVSCLNKQGSKSVFE